MPRFARIACVCVLGACARAPSTGVPEPRAVAPAPVGHPQAAASNPAPAATGWSPAEIDAVLADTRTVTLSADLSTLTRGERACVERLLEAGRDFQALYEDSLHAEALAAKATLAQRAADPHATKLLELYRLFSGPIGTTPDNRRAPLLPVSPPEPGANVYPVGLERAELEAFLAAHEHARPSLLHPRTVVRRGRRETLDRDLEVLRADPELARRHPGLIAELTGYRTGEPPELYAVPYAVAYGPELARISEKLHRAADAVSADDRDFARYLVKRAEGLLTNDYEESDAAWVGGRFRRLNAQLGAYEAYDDALLGVKTFFAASILVRDETASRELQRGIRGIQRIEDALPTPAPKRVREDIPVGIYDVVADYGQARGANTATILPNETHIVRRYGRTILMRANILRNPDIFENSRATWTAVVAPELAADLTPDGGFWRTLWHEVGHYLGVDLDRRGRPLPEALQHHASALEEMKADLVALFAARLLRQSGVYDDARVRAVYAAGIRRTLQRGRPRPSQPYQTMQLVQFNYFLARGLVRLEPETARLTVDYERYHTVVRDLLEEVLAVQYAGDPVAAGAFMDRYGGWDDGLHGVVAARMRSAQVFGYLQVRYASQPRD